MIDLTKITTPFGLLDRETQEALKAHGGPYEVWHWARNEWMQPDGAVPKYAPQTVYRVKPAPPKPREWWITLYDGLAWDDELSAKNRNACFKEAAGQIIHVREVLE